MVDFDRAYARYERLCTSGEPLYHMDDCGARITLGDVATALLVALARGRRFHELSAREKLAMRPVYEAARDSRRLDERERKMRRNMRSDILHDFSRHIHDETLESDPHSHANCRLCIVAAERAARAAAKRETEVLK